MDKQRIVIIGSSAGGVMALKDLIASLPAGFNAPIFVVQHVAADAKSHLPEILSVAGVLRSSHPTDGEMIEKGHVYVAPPDHHMIVQNDQILVRRGPKENTFRPSIDVTMRSAAYWYGKQVIGVVLTGRLSDGTSGIWTIKEAGGITIVQDPAEAIFPDMPKSVVSNVDVDYVKTLAEIGPLLVNLVAQPAENRAEAQPLGSLVKTEVEIATQKNAFESGMLKIGERTDLTCPECGGSLRGIQEGSLMRYRCHTGHAYSQESLRAEIADKLEISLWQAVRHVEEGIILSEQLASQCESSHHHAVASKHLGDAEHFRKKSKILLDLIYDLKIAEM